MKTRNPKIIGLCAIIVGLGVLLFWGSILIKIIALPLTSNTAEAKVIGFKMSANGAHVVQNETSIKTAVSGRSPFFEFVSNENKLIKCYSNAPQLFILFRYEIGEKVVVAYSNEAPQKAVIVSWKEFPGLLLMFLFGVLLLMVGKDFLIKENQPRR